MLPIHKNPLRWRPKPEERLKFATAVVGFATAVVVLLAAVVELAKLL